MTLWHGQLHWDDPKQISSVVLITKSKWCKDFRKENCFFTWQPAALYSPQKTGPLSHYSGISSTFKCIRSYMSLFDSFIEFYFALLLSKIYTTMCLIMSKNINFLFYLKKKKQQQTFLTKPSILLFLLSCFSLIICSYYVLYYLYSAHCFFLDFPQVKLYGAL